MLGPELWIQTRLWASTRRSRFFSVRSAIQVASADLPAPFAPTTVMASPGRASRFRTFPSETGTCHVYDVGLRFKSLIWLPHYASRSPRVDSGARSLPVYSRHTMALVDYALNPLRYRDELGKHRQGHRALPILPKQPTHRSAAWRESKHRGGERIGNHKPSTRLSRCAARCG